MKKRGQKHQNKVAFSHNKGSRLTKIIAEEPITLMCPRCEAQLVWKKQYRKYKMRTVPGRCNLCQEKTIKLAYRKICDKCAKERDLCAKCQKPRREEQEDAEETKEETEFDSDDPESD